MKTVYFVRHGQSEANVRRITAGGGLDVDLTDNGKLQAAQVGQSLKKKHVQLIVSSPQIRALHTARIIAAEIGYNADAIVTSELFVERHLGIMTGKPHDEVQLWFDMNATPEGGESSQQMYDRVRQGLAWLQSLPQDTVLLVSHGGPGRALRAILREEKHTSVNNLSSVGNAQLLELHL